jgi:hypothetical protein
VTPSWSCVCQRVLLSDEKPPYLFPCLNGSKSRAVTVLFRYLLQCSFNESVLSGEGDAPVVSSIGTKGRPPVLLCVVPNSLPAMPFHTYRPGTPTMGSVGLAVAFMTANTVASTPARSATARNSTELTQRPALMNFFSEEPGTLSHSHVQHSIVFLGSQWQHGVVAH